MANFQIGQIDKQRDNHRFSCVGHSGSGTYAICLFTTFLTVKSNNGLKRVSRCQLLNIYEQN